MVQNKSKKDEGALIAQADIKGKRNALDSMATRLEVSPETLKDTLRATAFKECKTDAHFIAAIIVANTYKLNPILREVTAFPGSGGGVVPVVMIDGWIKLVNRQENYNGVELVENENKEGKTNKSGTTLESITAKFFLKGREHAVIITEYMEECYDGTKGPWKRWPRRMLRHKAYIQGARLAFGFAGIYDEDEAQRIREGEALEIVKEPIIGLKHDNAGKGTDAGLKVPPGEDLKGKEAPSEAVIEAEIVPKWDDFGDSERFGAQGKSMIVNLKKCANKLGQEKFMSELGKAGWSSVKEITKVADFAKVMNALLSAIAEKV